MKKVFSEPGLFSSGQFLELLKIERMDSAGNTADPGEIVVMKQDRHHVPAELHVTFNEQRAAGHGCLKAGKGVFRVTARVAPMGDKCWKLQEAQ